MALDAPNSEAIPISINAPSAYSPCLDGFMSTKSVGNQNIPTAQVGFLPGFARVLFLLGGYAHVVAEPPIQRRYRLISTFDIAGAQIIGIPANSPSPHIE
jgi:hypothetical protein